MPVMPPWLNINPQRQGDYFAEGARLGMSAAQTAAQIQARQAQLGQAAELAQMEMLVKQKQLAEARQMDEQRLRIENEYKRQVLGMQKLELDQRAREMAARTKQAADTLAAQKAYQTGMLDVRRGQLDMMRNSSAALPEFLKVPTEGGQSIGAVRVPLASGGSRYQLLTGGGSQASAYNKMYLQNQERHLASMEKSLAADAQMMAAKMKGPTHKYWNMYATAKNDIDRLRASINQAYMEQGVQPMSMYGQGGGAGEGVGEYLPGKGNVPGDFVKAIVPYESPEEEKATPGTKYRRPTLVHPFTMGGYRP